MHKNVRLLIVPPDEAISLAAPGVHGAVKSLAS
jgi:hypothetical protein